MAPPRKRKLDQSLPTTTTFSIGNCVVEFPSDADQEFSTEKLSLQVNQFASVKISVDKSKTNICETPTNAVNKSRTYAVETPSNAVDKSSNPRNFDNTLPSGMSFQVINPKGVDKINNELLKKITQLYKQELPAMSFAADTGKESDFLTKCTMNGKYCSLLLKKPGDSGADPEIVVGAITYQILPTSTQYAEIPLAAVDQSCQRQGLGKLLVGELARRLMSVGVLTLFCWGDQESEQFWNKQGFRKIAGVNAQGKPQKLRLKNEIRKALSLPGNSALMVCNFSEGINFTFMNACGTSHQTPGPTIVTPTIEKEVKAGRTSAEESPIPRSDALDPYSFGNDPLKTPLSSAVSPAPTAPLPSFSTRNVLKSKCRTYVKGSVTKLPIVAKLASGSTSPPAELNRTLKFSEFDSVPATENPSPVAFDQLVSTVACGNSEPAVKSFTENLSEDKATPTPMIDNPSNIDVKSREPLGNVQNIFEQGVVSLKKRPWRRTQCDNPKVTTAIEGPQSVDTGCGPGKENKELVKNEMSEAECDNSKSCRKRPRAEALSEKALGWLSVRGSKCDSPSFVNPAPQLLELASISEQVVTFQEAANPVFQAPGLQTPEPLMYERVSSVRKSGAAKPAIQALEPKPASISGQASTAQETRAAHHVGVLSRQTDSAARGALAVDCMQSLAQESLSPSSLGDKHLDLRLQKQGKDSTIRKRLSSRLIHVPEVGERSPLSLGCLKDFAKTTTPIVFLMNMPNDSKKRALAQLVEKLGGKVTGEGGECTHVVTSEVRRTLNFCTALCNGAWVVTPDWLKASNRNKSFVEEESYLLRDRQFESKYKISLATAILAAKRKPCSLFTGFAVYPTPRVQPPVDIVTKLTTVAGGKVLSSLDEAVQRNDPSHTIVLTGDEDTKDGDVATKAGLWTFKGEWLMQAIVKQRIDFDTVIPSDC